MTNPILHEPSLPVTNPFLFPDETRDRDLNFTSSSFRLFIYQALALAGCLLVQEPGGLTCSLYPGFHLPPYSSSLPGNSIPVDSGLLACSFPPSIIFFSFTLRDCFFLVRKTTVTQGGEASIQGPCIVCKNRLKPKTAFGSPLVISVELIVHYMKNMMSLCHCSWFQVVHLRCAVLCIVILVGWYTGCTVPSSRFLRSIWPGHPCRADRGNIHISRSLMPP